MKPVRPESIPLEPKPSSIATQTFDKAPVTPKLPDDIDKQDREGATALILAIVQRDKRTAVQLITNGANINIVTQDGNSALIFAVIRGDADMVSLLLAHKADPNVQNKNKDTPLIAAAAMGYIEIINLLIKNKNYKIDLTAKDGEGRTAANIMKKKKLDDSNIQYHLGIMYEKGQGVPQNYSKAFKCFTLAAEKNCAAAKYNIGLMHYNGKGRIKNCREGIKWLRFAAEQGYADAQQDLGNLYYHGEDVLQSYSDAFTWFKLAAEQGHIKAQYTLGTMYNEGISVPKNYAEAFKWFKLSAEQGYAEAQHDVALMYYKGKNVAQDSLEAIKWLQLASKQGKMASRRFLANISYEPHHTMKPVRPESIAPDSKPSLITTQTSDKTPVTPKLSNINEKDKKGNTALIRAAEIGDDNMVSKLLENHPDVNIRNSEKRTALSLAVENGHLKVVSLLLSVKGIKINESNDPQKYSMPLLMLAARAGHVKIASLLLDTHQVDIDETHSSDHTALMEAAMEDQYNMVDLLLKHKANPELQEKTFKRTALMLAAEFGNPKATAILIAHGVNLNTRDNFCDQRYETAFALAIRKKNEGNNYDETDDSDEDECDYTKSANLLIEGGTEIDFNNPLERDFDFAPYREKLKSQILFSFLGPGAKLGASVVSDIVTDYLVGDSASKRAKLI